MISFEQAIYEAHQFITRERSRYDLEYILIESDKVVATDGKRLYVAHVENVPATGLVKIARIKGGAHRYPRPKKSSIKHGSNVFEEHGIKWLDTLGTRFRFSPDAKFPPIDKVIPQNPELMVLENPKAFVDAMKSLRKYGKKLSQEHLFATGDKIKPDYRVILYKNGCLHLVMECALGKDNLHVPVLHCKLADLGEEEHKSLIVFDPELYALKEAPVAIGIHSENGPIIFHLGNGRQVLIMPIQTAEEIPLRIVENALCWDGEYEPESVS